VDLPLTSPSQVKLGSECLRKWGFRYIDGDKPPQGVGAALGQEVDDTQIQPWLRDGRQFDFSRLPSGEIAVALAPLLPAPKAEGILLQRHYEIPSPSGKFLHQGYLDIFAPNSGIVPGLEGGRALIADVKTTRDLKYALTPDMLAVDPQAMSYATAIMFEENVDELDLVWFYVRSRKPHRAQRSHLRVGGTANVPGVSVTSAHVVEQFRKIDVKASELVQLKLTVPKGSELPPNPRMCEAYGGCPYRWKCNLSPAIHADSINLEAIQMNAATNDFLAQLRKGAPPPPAPTAAPQYTAPVASPAPPAAPAPAELPAWATAPVDPLHNKSAVPAFIRSAVAINPPESALPPAPPVGVAVAPTPTPAQEPAKRTRRTKAEMAAAGDTDVPAGIQLPDVPGLVQLMTTLKIKGLAFDGANVISIELV
jgi:hypothetical protein